MTEDHASRSSAARLVVTTAPDAATARVFAETLVGERLAACVHCLPPGTSTYRWNDTIESATEVTLMIKTSLARVAELECRLCELHPYDIPEILVLPITGGLPPYLDWIAECTS